MSAFADRALKALVPEASAIMLHPDDAWLNDDFVPEGHRFAVLEEDGDTLGTGCTQDHATKTAVIKEISRLLNLAKQQAQQIRRMRDAVAVLLSGGE